MATAFALLESYSSFKETLAGAADKARVAADKARAAVVEQTKGVVGMAREQLSASGLLPEQYQALTSPLQGLEQGEGQAQGTKGGAAQQQTVPTAADESSQLLEELNQACNLTFKQRVYGFAGCLSIGFLCCILSLFVLFHPIKFGLAYSLGNLLSLGSTGFLIGFKRQLTMMFDPMRRIAAVIFVIMAVVTLLCALLIRDPLLTLVCIVVQGSALLWYSLSYIPYAQAAAKRLARLFFTAEF